VRRRIPLPVVIGTLLAVAVTAIVATLPRHGILAHTAADDAFYYFAIAKRAGDAHWPTFDGTHTTTGFHPLWMFLLVPLAKAIASPWIFIRLAIAVSSLLMISSALVFGSLFSRTWGTSAGSVGALLLVASPGSARLGWMAMEAPLALVLLALFLREAFRRRLRPARLGAFAGLAVLARLDMAIVVAVAICWLFFVVRKLSVRAAAVAGAVAIALVAPYIAWNVVLTGHVQTISAATKAFVADSAATRVYGGRLTWGFAGRAVTELLRAAGEIARLSPATMIAGPVALAGGDHPAVVDSARHGGAILLLSLCALVAGYFITRRYAEQFAGSARHDGAALLAVLLIASALHTGAACVLLTGQSGPWYWGLEVVTLVAAASYAGARWQAALKLTSVLSGASLVSMAMLGGGLIASRVAGNFNRRTSFASVMVEAGEALDARRSPGEVAGSCNAGTLGFFEPGTVNLDGLVNDWSFLEARRRGNIRGYLAREDVRWIVDCVPAAAMNDYRQAIGLRSDEIESIATIPAPACVGFVWHVLPPPAEKSPLAAREGLTAD
jgi:hypothetical protein